MSSGKPVWVIAWLVLAVMLSVSSLAHTTDEANSSARSRLQTILQDISVLRASFTQEVTDQNRRLLDESEGELVIAQPHRIRWVVKAPFPQALHSDGETLWHYEEDLEQVTTRPLRIDQLQQWPGYILATGELPAERYKVVELASQSEASSKESEQGRKRSRTTYLILPAGNSSVAAPQWHSMQLVLEAGIPARITIVDLLENRTEVVLSDVVLNGPASNAEFVFDVPAGVEVIGQP